MCNARALLITAAIGGIAATGGASLGLFGAGGAASAAGAAAGTTAMGSAAGVLGAVDSAAAMGSVASGAAAGISGAQALGLASAAVSAGSAWQQAQTQAAVARQNAQLATDKATEDERIGELNAQKINQQTNQLQGTQRATMAARGLDLGAGTPADIINQTSFFGQQDAATARYNGQMQAWADKQQAAGFSAQADGFDTSSGLSLLSGAGSVADKWLNRFGNRSTNSANPFMG